MVGAFQIFNFGIGQRPHTVCGGHGKGGAIFRLHRPLEQGRNFRLVHRLQQILHGVHPVGAVCVGRGACHKGQRRAAAPAAQLCRRRKPFGSGYRRKLDEVQLVPQPGGILLQKRFRALQLLHDAGVLPPGKELHALVLQPAAQRPVRAADRNVKDHGLASFAEKSS